MCGRSLESPSSPKCCISFSDYFGRLADFVAGDLLTGRSGVRFEAEETAMVVETSEMQHEANVRCCSAHEGTLAEAGMILLVEDEAFVREVTCEVLRSAGYRVLTAASADEAVCVYDSRGGDVDLLLTDVVLPGETGRTLAGKLRREDPDLKVLLVTGYGEQMKLREAQEECLPKPFSSEVLLGRVRQLLDRGEVRKETKIGSGVPAVTGSVEDLCGYLGERDHAAENAHVGAGSRHAIDGA